MEDIVPVGIEEILKLAEEEGYIEIVKEKDDRDRESKK